MNRKTISVVCAIVKDGEKILMTQRLRKGAAYMAEKWEFPGGKIEANESEQTALWREIKEEMDWEIYIGKRLGEIVYAYPDFDIQLIAYECIAPHHNFKLLSHLNAKWVTKAELPSQDWAAADAQLIKEIWKYL